MVRSTCAVGGRHGRLRLLVVIPAQAGIQPTPNNLIVIPAEAGIQPTPNNLIVIPAEAGIQRDLRSHCICVGSPQAFPPPLDSRLRGNDGRHRNGKAENEQPTAN